MWYKLGDEAEVHRPAAGRRAGSSGCGVPANALSQRRRSVTPLWGMRGCSAVGAKYATQDVRSQRLAILEYARTQDIRIDDFIEATASG